ncbi:TetR/AcrR family transcriptional regulator [Martelella mediterranea]|uniref:TetR family transcriptional regulator n=1 Tax=Martelella mediterranea TaxID=293089 RepID=A0A4V2V502_9HYPH|nr:TetR/AcrR family transcriptional regulator [Martelella mediterranea]TCT45131.1 TetR family transcriptional regulator [Martelella mediterranea]
MASGHTALERLESLAPERRALLLETAASAFAENGFSDASFNAILKAAKVSKGQAYYYVRDKGDLYCAVIEKALGELISQVDFSGLMDVRDAESFWMGLDDAFARIADLLIADPRLAALGRTMYEGPSAESAIDGPLNHIREAVGHYVKLGQMLNAIRSDVPLTMIVEMIFSAGRALDGWFAENWDDLAPEEARRLNIEGLKMIRAMVAPAARQSPVS